MFIEHISGLARSGAASRSSNVMPWPPPVVMLMTALVACLMRGRNCMKTSGSGVGLPSFGSRACRCRIAAPASAAAIASRATSSGVSGRYGLIVGVWIEPVTAQVMMTLLFNGISVPSLVFGSARPRRDPTAQFVHDDAKPARRRREPERMCEAGGHIALAGLPAAHQRGRREIRHLAGQFGIGAFVHEAQDGHRRFAALGEALADIRVAAQPGRQPLAH